MSNRSSAGVLRGKHLIDTAGSGEVAGAVLLIGGAGSGEAASDVLLIGEVVSGEAVCLATFFMMLF